MIIADSFGGKWLMVEEGWWGVEGGLRGGGLREGGVEGGGGGLRRDGLKNDGWFE